MKSQEPDKDEFGRDIRPGSVDPEPFPMPATQPVSNTTATAVPTTQSSPIVQDLSPNHQNPTLHSATTSSSTNEAQPETAMPIATYESRAGDTSATKGLESFDFTAFDFTSPASWEALGKAWEVTNGVTPTQEVLMQFMMMLSMGMGPGVGGFEAGQPQDQYGTQGSGGWSTGEMGWSDGGAEVIGETQDQEKPDGETPDPEKEDSPVPGERSVGSTGKMQKVGDRWVFVRS